MAQRWCWRIRRGRHIDGCGNSDGGIVTCGSAHRPIVTGSLLLGFRLSTRKHERSARDEKAEAKVGDTVRIEESRPLSKLKRWKLIEVVERGEALTAVAA